MYRLTDITKDGKTRTDGRYPLRIGSLVEIVDMCVGWRLNLSYVKDADGNEKSGFLSTSQVVKIDSTPSLDVITVTTLNSVYTLTKA
jgi:hypothetical protein